MSIDDIKKRFVNEIKLRAYDDKYIDKNEEREILQIAIQLGVSIERVTEGALRELGLAGDAMRNLIGWCHETQQPIDLQVCVDDATLARIWSNVLRFRCPHCGTKHETKVQRLASRPFSLEPPKTKRTRHQHARSVDAKSVTNVLARA